MIEEDREFGGFTVYCDRCSHSVDVDEETWANMIEEIKRDGWRISRDDDGAWEHICPSCVEIA